MRDQIKPAEVPPANVPDLRRSQAIFVTVGMSIIVGGLYFLYQSAGPYHPDGPLTDVNMHSQTES